MQLIRFILPFLFVRNWYSGSWEFSRARFVLFMVGVFFVCAGILIAYYLQTPVTYNAT